MFNARSFIPLAAALTMAVASPVVAQPAGNAKADVSSLVGSWSGKASIAFGDSTISVPVSYTFTQSGKTVAGTAMVPGQGQGQISNVVRTGTRVQFRVTVTPATVANSAAGASSGVTIKQDRHLEHEGTIGADGAIEGMVQMDSQPIASFRIAPVKAPK